MEINLEIQPILSTNWEGKTCELRLTKGAGDSRLVMEGEIVSDGARITGGRAPHKPASCGFVYVLVGEGDTREYYATVYDMVWVPTDTKPAPEPARSSGTCEDAPCCGCCGPQGDGDYYGYSDYPDY